MRPVIYADVLFFINFAMDLISIWLTFLIVHQGTNSIRLLSASCVGGLYGVLSVIIGAGRFISFILSLIVSFVMILISSAGKLKFKKYVEYTLILWGVGALCGGVISALCSLGNRDFTGFATHNSPFFVIAFGAALASAAVKLISKFKCRPTCRVRFKAFGNEFEFNGMTDTGNCVKEPISGLPVIFVSKSVFKGRHIHDVEILSTYPFEAGSLSDEAKRKIRLVTIDRIDRKIILPSFIPESVYIIKGKQSKRVRSLIVIEKKDDYCGFDGILPGSLLQ